MRRLFADTFYWIALLYRRDRWHARVTAFSQTLTDADIIWTTDAVFVEVLAALSAGGAHMRHEAVLLVDAWLNDPGVRVVEATRSLFLDGLSLYRVRPDKEYPYSDTCRTYAPNTRIYGCIRSRFPPLLATVKPRFYMGKFCQRTQVTL